MDNNIVENCDLFSLREENKRLKEENNRLRSAVAELSEHIAGMNGVISTVSDITSREDEKDDPVRTDGVEKNATKEDMQELLKKYSRI